jgi:DNA polymerase III sliding clamp (beta) subunit (PCNA family)
MEFVVNLEDIQRAMKLLNSVARQNTDDVIGQVVLDVRNTGELILLCNNGSLALTHLITNCKVQDPGVTCVSFGKLSSFLNSFSSWEDDSGVKGVKFKALKNDLSLSLDNHFIGNKKTTHKLKLKLYPSQKVAVPTPFEETTLEINSATLRLAISKVIYAINPASVRTFLQGVNINFEDNSIYFAGTDAQMLSEYRTSNTGNLTEGNFTISYNFIMALRKIIDAESDVRFSIKDGKIKALINTTTLHGNLLIGEEYPQYAQAFENYTHEITINKDIMLSSFVPFMNTLDVEDHSRLTISINNNRLIVRSDFAESEYHGDINFDGELIVDINGSYLFQTLNAIMDDVINMKFSDDGGVLIFDSEQFRNQKALITPVRRR